MNKCVFLDRDGVINQEVGDYVYTQERFQMISGVHEAVAKIKQAGYLIIVITNQAGISKGIYTVEQMQLCHDLMQKELQHQVDYVYYSPWHPSVSDSLSRKPGTLMFERAIARFDIDVARSWMVGDRERDLIPAKKLGIQTIQVGGGNDQAADFAEQNLIHAVDKQIVSK